jgi:hypothetical protein
MGKPNWKLAILLPLTSCLLLPGCVSTLDRSSPGGQLYELKAALVAALPTGMIVTRAETHEREGVRSFTLHAGSRDRSRAYPSFAVSLWPVTPGRESPHHRSAGAHTFTYVGSTEKYEIFYSGPEGALREIALRAFTTER